MEIKLKPQESEEHFYNALCNGVPTLNMSGLKLSAESSEVYTEAKQRLLNNNMKDICREDVWMEVLRGGKRLMLVDIEGNEETKYITLSDVHEKVEKTPIKHLTDAIQQTDDAYTADAILQTVFLGEIIYG